MEELVVSGKRCMIEETGTVRTVFLWAYHDFSGNGPERLTEKLRGLPSFQDAAIAAFSISDWDAELSPWEASAAFEEERFRGNGPETLLWLAGEYLPYLKKRYPEAERFVPMGYSLAGLFSLWALYETDCFSGCICCSGSLWIEGWDAYQASHRLKNRASVYLSLGGKEEKTDNPLMKTVGDRTREQEKFLRRDPNCADCVLTWNKGGHFADAEARLVKGIQWFMQSSSFSDGVCSTWVR